MKTIEMIHPFKGLKVGEVVNREDEQADWLCSRKYAIPVAPVVSSFPSPVSSSEPKTENRKPKTGSKK